MSATTLRPEQDVEEPSSLPFQTDSLTSEVLQRRAPHNLRRHWLRDSRRVAVLVLSDLAMFWLVRMVLRAVRRDAFGAWLGDHVSGLFPSGFLGGWQFSVALILSLLIVGSYGAGDLRKDVGRLWAGAGLAGLLSLYAAAWESAVLPLAIQYVGTVVVFGSLLVLSRTLVDLAVRMVRVRLGGARAVLVAHVGFDWREIADFAGPSREFLFVGAVRLPTQSEEVARYELLKLAEVIEQRRADTVLLWGDLTDSEFAVAVDIALVSGCRLLSQSRTPLAKGIEPSAVWVGGKHLIQLTAPSLLAWQLAAKRVLDMVGAIMGLLLLSPLLLAIAVWVKFDSPGPVLFAQDRLGARGRLFRCFKFRSMRRDAESMLRSDDALFRDYVSNNFKLPEDADPRVTRSGRFLRRTSLDELPQLINVLLGHMSLVGPRPIVPAELEHYGGVAPLFLSTKPGLTGAWAVSGRSDVGYPDRAHLELAYIRQWSLLTDLSILFRTIPAVFARRGAH